MKKILLATAALAAMTTTASAAELFGTGIYLDTEVVGEYAVDAENATVTISPEASYATHGFVILAGTDLAIYDGEFVADDTFGQLPTVNFEVDYYVAPSAYVYVTTSYDLDAGDRGDIIVGASFSF